MGKGSNDALIKCSQCSTGILITQDMSRGSAWMKFLEFRIPFLKHKNDASTQMAIKSNRIEKRKVGKVS